MLNIEEKDLELFLEQNKDKLETKRISGLGEIISGISLCVTLLCSEFEKNQFLSVNFLDFFAWLIALLVLIVGIYRLGKGICNPYTVKQIFDEIKELDADTKHVFNIVLIKNSDSKGEYLLFKNKRWRCKLFPNYHALDKNYDKVKETENLYMLLPRDIGVKKENLSISYHGFKPSAKYSYGDKINKNYIFHFYVVDIAGNEKIKHKPFRFNGKRYCWMTLENMYLDKNISKKNSDVLDYVRNNMSIS